MNGVDLQLPPGFRFHPTDEELVIHYLCRKCASLPISVPIITELDLYKYNPWDLPGMAMYGEKEWYFFTPRDRKYPNGSRPNRAAGLGYWKATGADKPIGSPKPVGIKKALVFYTGKAPKGDKTNWIMHEYRLANVDRTPRRKNSLRLDDWVLCRIYNKRGGGGAGEKQAGPRPGREVVEQKPVIGLNPTGPHVRRPNPNLNPNPNPNPMSELMCLDPSESLPRLHADSSCSEHVISSNEFTCDREVQSQPRWREDWEKALEMPLNYMNATLNGFPHLEPVFKDPLQDIFMHLQKPF